MAARVFVPVSFIGGSTVVFYKQFGLTLAIAIILSAIKALTLSRRPLCYYFETSLVKKIKAKLYSAIFTLPSIRLSQP